jgi:DNA-binding GntR family transcriptional regulator
MASGWPDEVVVGRLKRPLPLREAVYEALLELISRGALRPGQHLVESELAERLGVSRQPVREALQRLSNHGWVDLRPTQGAFVHQPTLAEADQLLAVRALFEAEAARLAAANAADGSIERLRELWREGVAAVAADDLDAVVAANAALHACVMELAANDVLAELAAQVSTRVRWYYTPVARQRGAQSWEEHAALIDAIAAHDQDRAAQVMREHTEQTRRSFHQRRQQAEDDDA